MQKELTAIPNVMQYASGKDKINLVVVVPTAELEKFGSIIQKASLRLQRIPKLKGKPSEILANLKEEKGRKESQLKTVEENLRALAEKHYAKIVTVEEQLAIEARKLEVINNFGFTDNSFVLEGWVPEHKLASLQETIGRYAKSATLFKIESSEKPPTLLENPKRLRFFESFIRFYSCHCRESSIQHWYSH